jgi:hypothetical protein
MPLKMASMIQSMLAILTNAVQAAHSAADVNVLNKVPPLLAIRPEKPSHPLAHRLVSAGFRRGKFVSSLALIKWWVCCPGSALLEGLPPTGKISVISPKKQFSSPPRLHPRWNRLQLRWPWDNGSGAAGWCGSLQGFFDHLGGAFARSVGFQG